MSRSFSRTFFLSLAAFCLALALSGCISRAVIADSDNDDDKFNSEQAQSAEQTPAAATSTDSGSSTPLTTPSPIPTATPSPTATATPVPTATPTATATPTPTPTPQFPPEFYSALQMRSHVLSDSDSPSDEEVVEQAAAKQATAKQATAKQAKAGQLRSDIAVFSLDDLAHDPDGELVSVEILDGPDSLTLSSSETLGPVLIFRPGEAGTETASIKVTDDQGLSAVSDIELVARYRGHPKALVALGDSVASGHGLELADYFGTDPCFRSANSYPRRAFNALVEAGLLKRSEAEFALLACSGHDTNDIFERLVTSGFSDITPPSGKRSQLDWAIRSNPQLITITIGANDTGFVRPRRLFNETTAELDHDQIQRRVDVISNDLSTILEALVKGTDATIFVTNYYNPVSSTPHGIEGCELDCFFDATEHVVTELNTAIESTVARYDTGRVKYVDIKSVFDGKGAPNGLGPDELRQAGLGTIDGQVIAADVAGIHPYCQKGHEVRDTLISAVDCVHPDEAGTAEIASIIASEIAAHLVHSLEGGS